jgi:hypothetical protein
MGNYEGSSGDSQLILEPKTIEIVFENKNTEISMGDEIGEYYSHPAFQAFDSNGLWVGKFETVGEIDNLQIKPNKKALDYINVKTMFESSFNYKANNNSHMMKNTEWGAIAYLSVSIYGINDKININNNSNLLTGYSANTNTNQSSYPGEYGVTSDFTLPYNTETGYLASTTGNISGVYDMSGGSYEYTASYLINNYINSGFTEDPVIIYGEKYFDVYLDINYNNRILGDATGEMGPFYYYCNDSDDSYRFHNSWWANSSVFLKNTQSWFSRGGGYRNGYHASQNTFYGYNGTAMVSFTFRIILAK